MNEIITEKMKGNRTRNTTIEALRIVAILLIILSHYSIHGSFDVATLGDDGYFKLTVLQCAIQGNLGVDLFILISGYFLISSRFNIKKIVLFVCEVWFYSVGIYLLLCSIGLIKFSPDEFIVALFPTCYEEYWFFTAYFLIICCSPIINAGILAISKKSFRNGLMLFIVIWSLIPTVSAVLGLFFPEIKQAALYSNPFLQLLFVYCMGAYIRLYEPKFLNRRNGAIMLIGSFVLLFASVVFINVAEYHGWLVLYQPNVLFDRLSPLTILCACGLFSIVLGSKPTHVKAINTIASSVFGVYLIHDNPFMRELIWGRFFDNSIVYGKLLIIHMIVSVIIVFGVCVLIELMRKGIVEYPLKKLLERIETALKNNRSNGDNTAGEEQKMQ